MTQTVKYLPRFVLFVGSSLLLFAFAMYFLVPAVTNLWIWPHGPVLGFVFVASMLAGAAIPLVWIGLSGQLSALRATMLTGIVANSGIAFHLYRKHSLPGNENYLPYVALFAVGALLTIGAFLFSQKLPADQDKPTPPIIRWVFLFFAVVLLLVGGALVFDTQYIFPVPLRTDMAAIYGWFFLGSFTYYFYGFLRPSQLNSTGHMLSFLIYDLFMIPPYGKYWATVPPEYQFSLLVYLTVLITSAIFCSYFLFVDTRTRLVWHS